jgi:RND superfamily putative drug exporter
MSTVEAVRDAAEDVAADVETAEDRAVNVYLAGLTSYIVSVRDVVGDDQIRVMLLATLVIAVIVALLVRDIPLTIFMLLATWLTFGMTITLTNLFFIHVIGQEGLDYKVRLIVFVIVVAVGQDYNIFLVTRMIEEDASNDPAGAKRAIVRTGSVISNCGLIMAATLGSLWAGGLMLLQQLGFALALGVLIDTFFVRSLLLPSFFLATKRRAKSVLAAAAHG